MINGYVHIEDCDFLDYTQNELVSLIENGTIKDAIAMSDCNYYISNEEIEKLIRQQQNQKRGR